jgi:hypothetical protein
MTSSSFGYDKINKEWSPAVTREEDDSSQKWSIPDEIRKDYYQLNSIIETKYTREFLKICAFYNKMFPSLKYTGFHRSFYNVPPFTAMDQERQDTGTGISANYLKEICDQIVARIGTITFDPKVLSDEPTLSYIIYKDDVERLLRRSIRNEHYNAIVTDVFHDAAIVGYSHVIINPITSELQKVNDYELGVYEAQFTKGHVRQALWRDYAFPITELVPYLVNQDKETVDMVIENYGNKEVVDFKMYFDCPNHKVWVTINGDTLPAYDYPFDEVQMVTFSWDIGFTKVASTSLFDLLYPIQREVNKVKAKIQQLVRMYKGPVPVFSQDVDLAMKSISNGSGEALYVDTTRPIDSLMTVINPTPLDTALDAQVVSYKTEMYELAGLQQMTLTMENMRSAAAVIAVDQTKDMVFQAQLNGIARFEKDTFRMMAAYNAATNNTENGVDWKEIKELIDNAYIDLIPVHVNDPLSNQANSVDAQQPDYQEMYTARVVKGIAKGDITFDNIDYSMNLQDIEVMCAERVVQLGALGVKIPDSMFTFMISAFVHEVKVGSVALIGGNSNGQ